MSKLNNKLYQWTEDLTYSSKEDGEVIWRLNLFRGDRETLPFLNRQRVVAPHKLEIRTFSPKPHERPYRQEKVSEGPDTITYRKVFLSDYLGNVDAELGLLWAGSADSMGRGAAYFLNGEFKDSCGASDDSRFKTPGEFKKYLTEYLINGSIRNFGTHLGVLIAASNLPEKQKNAVRGLIG
jgi:hypothetical protein